MRSVRRRSVRHPPTALVRRCAHARFLGYGNGNAPLWILGREDSGDEVWEHGRSLAGSLRVRSKWHVAEDLKHAREMLGAGRKPRGGYPWAFASRLVLELVRREAVDACHDEDASRLGHGDGPVVLGDLYPLPLRRGKFGHYARVWPSEAVYRAEVGPRRACRFVGEWRRRRSLRAVVMYGGGADLILAAWGPAWKPIHVS